MEGIGGRLDEETPLGNFQIERSKYSKGTTLSVLDGGRHGSGTSLRMINLVHKDVRDPSL